MLTLPRVFLCALRPSIRAPHRRAHARLYSQRSRRATGACPRRDLRTGGGATERRTDDTEGVVDVDAVAAACCGPSLAMMREREMRSLRACCGLVDARSGLVVARASRGS
jgi:hypothetical protein